MNKLRVSVSMALALACGGGAGFPPLAQAEEAGGSPHTVTANVGMYSQYVFRGLTQTNEDPALQGGFDYVHASGFYAGVWGSNISWFSDLNGGSVSLEMDGYLGYKKSWANGLTTDVGYLRYQYPGSYEPFVPGVVKPNTDEVYVGLGWKWATFKYSHSINDAFGVAESDGTSYLDLSVSLPLPNNFTLGLHAGMQKFEGSANDDLYSYEDYKASLGYSFGEGWTVTAAYTHSTAKDIGYTILGKNIGDDQFVLGVSRAL